MRCELSLKTHKGVSLEVPMMALARLPWLQTVQVSIGIGITATTPRSAGA